MDIDIDIAISIGNATSGKSYSGNFRGITVSYFKLSLKSILYGKSYAHIVL